MSGKPTISIVMPALNEEANIADAARQAVASLGDRFSDYEVLLINDGSRDRTASIMDEIALRDPHHFRVTHNRSPRNLGGVYKQGIAQAQYEYYVMIPGDNENPSSAMQAPYDAIGAADIVIPYPTNPQARTATRIAISKTYVTALNGLFGLHLRYYNGTVIHRTENLRSISIRTDSFAFQSEALVKLIHAGKTFVEVGIETAPQPGRKSRAFRAKNVAAVTGTILALALDVRLGRRANG